MMKRSPRRPVGSVERDMTRPKSGSARSCRFSPVADRVRCTPDWFVSNTVKRSCPGRGPVSFTRDHVPSCRCWVSFATSCVVRSAIERCSNAELPKVIGQLSSAVGPAEDGQRREVRESDGVGGNDDSGKDEATDGDKSCAAK